MKVYCKLEFEKLKLAVRTKVTFMGIISFINIHTFINVNLIVIHLLYTIIIMIIVAIGSNSNRWNKKKQF